MIIIVKDSEYCDIGEWIERLFGRLISVWNDETVDREDIYARLSVTREERISS